LLLLLLCFRTVIYSTMAPALSRSRGWLLALGLWLLCAPTTTSSSSSQVGGDPATALETLSGVERAVTPIVMANHPHLHQPLKVVLGEESKSRSEEKEEAEDKEDRPADIQEEEHEALQEQRKLHCPKHGA
jgi:hypothetical protein